MPKARKGAAIAQYNLGWMYYKDRGVPQSDTEALKWYRLAADQGFSSAQYCLGVMYANGQGVPKNMIIAYALVLAAALQSSHEDFHIARNTLMKELSKSDLEMAEALSLEIQKLGNLLAALDNFQNNSKEK